MPQLWQYARCVSVAAITVFVLFWLYFQNLPMIPNKLRVFFWSCELARSKRMAQAIGLLCGFAIWCWCEDFVGWQHDIANTAKRPPLLFHYLSRHFPCFRADFYKINACRIPSTLYIIHTKIYPLKCD